MVMVVTMGLLCSISPKASSQVVKANSSESAKAESGLRFLESGKGQAAVQAPSAVRASAATSHDSGLALSSVSKKTTANIQVPAPAAGKTVVEPSLSKGQIAGLVVGGVAGAVVGVPAIGSGIPLAIAFLIAGTVIAVGAGIGYGIVTLAERAYNAATN